MSQSLNNNIAATGRNNYKLSREKSYIIGFVSSIALSLIAYSLVVGHILSGWALVFVLGGLALVQCSLQLLLFLHLGQESRPRWRLGVFFFMLLIIFIIVVGSVWIMYSLNTRMMPSTKDMKNYMNSQSGI